MAVTAAMNTQVSQLYVGLFGRAPDADGLGYWVSKMAAGESFAQVAQEMFNTSPARVYFPLFYTNDQIVGSFYQNVLGRTADAQGLAYWSAQLNTKTQGQVVADMINAVVGYNGTDSVALAAKALFTNKVAVAEYYAETLLGGASGATAAIASVTASSDVSSAAAKAAIIDASQAMHGATYALTSDINHVIVPAGTAQDHVIGSINLDPEFSLHGTATCGAFNFCGYDNSWYGGNVCGYGYGGSFSNGITLSTLDKSTFTTGDDIIGNGHTVVDLAIQGLGWTTTQTGEFNVAPVTMTGVSTINLVNSIPTGGTGVCWFGSSFENTAEFNGANYGNISNISLSGNDGLNAEFDNLNTATGNLTIAVSAATTGEVCLDTGNKVDGMNVYAYVQNNEHGAGATASVGTAGVDITTGKGDACAWVTLSHCAYHSNGAESVVGDINLAHINMNVGGSCWDDIGLNVTNCAYADSAAATAGNTTVGNVAVNVGASGCAELYVFQTASADGGAKFGNATVGNVTLGNVNVSLDVSACMYSMTVGNYADAYGHGNATAGNMQLGNITLTGKADSGMTLSATNYAYADIGNATVGNLRLGNVTITEAGDADVDLCVYNNACVDTAGNAKAGNLTVGNVTQIVGSSDSTFYASNFAYTEKGAATVGNIAIAGDINLNNVANDGCGYVTLYQSADVNGKGTATAGSITLGNVNFNAAGNVTATNTYNALCVSDFAYAATGAASVGAITIGNITANIGIGSTAEVNVSACAYGTGTTTGAITIGNVNMVGATDAEACLYVYDYASSGSTGGITTGGISMINLKNGSYADVTIEQYGNKTGNTTINGNVSLQADHIYFSVSNCASAGNAGSISMGNLSLKGSNWNTGNENYIYNGASGGNTGGITVGNVALSAGKGQTLNLDVSSYASGSAGDIKIGNVAIALANTKEGNDVVVNLDISSSGGAAKSGNITVGSITLTAAGESSGSTKDGNYEAHVTIDNDTQGSNVVVGDIIVSGGVVETAGGKVVVDNFNNLTGWLSLSKTGAGSITIGNVDYSGYVGDGATNADATVIDVNLFKGASIITGATGGALIEDNSGQNSIVLKGAAGKDIVNLYATQSNVSDAGGVLTAAQSSMDTITGFLTGDKLEFTAGGISTVLNASATDYAHFLTNAESMIHGHNNYAYAATVGANTWVALTDGSGNITEVVELVGVANQTFVTDSGAIKF